jgi:hypothetical protein
VQGLTQVGAELGGGVGGVVQRPLAQQDQVEDPAAAPPAAHHVERHRAQPGLGVVDAGEAVRAGQRPRERLLHGVLRLRQVGGEREELHDQPAVAGVVHLRDVAHAHHDPRAGRRVPGCC